MSGRYENTNPRRRKKHSASWKRKLKRYAPTAAFIAAAAAILVLLIFLGRLGLGLLFSSTKETNPYELNETNISEIPSGPQNTEPEPNEEEQISAVLKEAEFVAAGYDYYRAISILESSKYYDTSIEMQNKVEEYLRLDDQLVSYDQINNITHIFFHSLIVDPSRAFDGEYTQDGYNQYMTTVDEFNAILESMYERGFVLVSPYDIAYEVNDNGSPKFVYGNIRLPEGKTPFVMSQDDLNYYGYMIGDVDEEFIRPAKPTTDGDGFAYKLVIGSDGYPTCLYMDENGNITSGDYDLVPLLEKFIQEHPDFSYHGARAILGMTGYEGVFGYRTKPAYEAELGTEAYQQEVADAKAVAACLREHGWVLASHSYGHPSYGEISAEKVQSDSDKWENTVGSIIGDVDIILYPNGSDIAGVEQYSMDNPKFKTLYDAGIRYFYNVDSHYAWTQLGEDYFRGGRRNLDGYRMYYHPNALSDLFDVSEVFDPARPTPVPSI